MRVGNKGLKILKRNVKNVQISIMVDDDKKKRGDNVSYMKEFKELNFELSNKCDELERKNKFKKGNSLIL